MVNLACYAHSRPGRPLAEWETLACHAAEVAADAAEFARVFGWAGMAAAAGQLHDAGKCSAEFQTYIQATPGSPAAQARVDHSTKGAQLACELYPRGHFGRMLALCVAGHHAGLADPEELDARLGRQVPVADGWRMQISVLELSELLPTRRFPPSGSHWEDAFSRAFIVRMIFSCLVDADFLATERFYAAGAIRRGVSADMELLRKRLASAIDRMEETAPASAVNKLRAQVHAHAQAKAEMPPGFFTLTVPTGGGKTLTSLAFALAHAHRHAKRRIIYVIPFTSIIEQTAATFRGAIGVDVVLEHHASFDWEAAGQASGDGGDEHDGFGVLRRAAENWDAPVIVTTAVQFFESLFASRTSACRKLHNIADAVIVLDEAQMLPNALLLPCLAALRELVRNYGASVVLCTATQPALRNRDGALIDRAGRALGLDIGDDRELAPSPTGLHTKLQRVRVEVRNATSDAEIATRFAEVPRMMCIVNSRRHARELFDRIAHLPGAAHLTTLMCPAHRSGVLADLRAKLGETDTPVRLVATSLVEAGVDIDFPEVWRAASGIDSIAQAAGRCNREGRLDRLGRVVVFAPADHAPPQALVAFQRAAQSVLPHYLDDPLAPDAISAYFRELYFQKGIEALDAKLILGRRGVLEAIHDGAAMCRFPFRTIAEQFRLIDDAMTPVVVPFDKRAVAALERLAHAERPVTGDFRTIQRYTVGIPREALQRWLQAGEVLPVRRGLGAGLLRFRDLGLYRASTGIDLSDSAHRRAEDNVW